jgi:hypothetical protein
MTLSVSDFMQGVRFIAEEKGGDALLFWRGVRRGIQPMTLP